MYSNVGVHSTVKWVRVPRSRAQAQQQPHAVAQGTSAPSRASFTLAAVTSAGKLPMNTVLLSFTAAPGAEESDERRGRQSQAARQSEGASIWTGEASPRHIHLPRRWASLRLWALEPGAGVGT